MIIYHVNFLFTLFFTIFTILQNVYKLKVMWPSCVNGRDVCREYIQIRSYMCYHWHSWDLSIWSNALRKQATAGPDNRFIRNRLCLVTKHSFQPTALSKTCAASVDQMHGCSSFGKWRSLTRCSFADIPNGSSGKPRVHGERLIYDSLGLDTHIQLLQLKIHLAILNRERFVQKELNLEHSIRYPMFQ